MHGVVSTRMLLRSVKRRILQHRLATTVPRVRGRLLLKRMSEPVGVAVQPQLKCDSPPLHTMEHGGVHERIERKDQEPPPLHR